MKYIVVTNPGTYDCAISEFFGNKEDALIYYDEFAGYGSRPILARVLDVKLVADESNICPICPRCGHEYDEGSICWGCGIINPLG